MAKALPKIGYFINDTISRRVTKREFLNSQKEEITSGCIAQNILIKNKTFTRPEIHKLISAEVLVPVEYKGKLYFKKEEVLAGIKHNFKPRNLFSG